MKLIVCLLIGVTVALAQDCVPQVEDFYKCVAEGKGKKSKESGSEEGPDPEEIKAKVEELNACFTDNGCRSPSDVKECIMGEVDLEPMKECLDSKDLGIPSPDFSMFQKMGKKGAPLLKMIMKKAKMVKTMLGGKVPPFLISKMEEKISMACADAPVPEEATAAVKSCILETLELEEGEEGEEGGFPFPPPGAGGPPPFMRGKGKGGMGGMKKKFVKKIFSCMKKHVEGKDCRKKLMQLAGAVCCCGKEVDMRGKMKSAAEECGVSDTSMIDKMGDKVEKLICRKKTCDA